MSPYYGKYICKHKISEKVEIILVPLRNGCHFIGYIINLQRKEVFYVDSMFPPKYGRRSIATKLINTYFPTESNKVTLSSFYEHRFQHDSHACGASSTTVYMHAGIMNLVNVSVI